MSIEAMNDVVDQAVLEFEHTPLESIDPSDDTVEEGVYDLEVIKTSKQEYADGTKYFYKLQVGIVNDRKYSGKRLFPILFPDGNTLKTCKRIADATGIPQDAGETTGEWIIRLGTITPRPVFRVKVIRVVDKKRTAAAKALDPEAKEIFRNDLVWREVTVAQ